MEWTELVQQLPVAVVLVYIMERFLRHLDNRDRTLAEVLREFTVAVREMSKEVHSLDQTVAKLESRFEA